MAYRNLADGGATPVSKAYRKTHPGLRPKAIPVMGGTKSDPYNWKGIAAQLSAQKQSSNAQKNTKKSAQKRVQASAKVNQRPAVAQRSSSGGGPAAPAVPVQTPKQLLDAFRAANGGALPPGMTPESAGLIDAGIDIGTLQTANPAAANALLLIQQQLLAMPGAYDASRAKITADYNALTGDVTTAGQEWMNTLYGNVVNPGDPNAAQFAADPAFANYANNLGQIEETGDINEATDLAWFTKNQQAQQAYLESLRMGVAGGTIPVGAAIDGGGGGGGGGGGRGGGRRGGGRGYGGYGGGGYGGGDSDWSDPKTTSTRSETQTETGTSTVADYNVEFFESLMAAAGDDPKLQDLALRTFMSGGQTPIGVTKQLGNDITAAQLQAAQYDLQEDKRGNWLKTMPVQEETRKQKWRNNLGFVRGDDPRTPKVEQWHIPPENSSKALNLTDEQQIENQVGQELFESRLNPNTQNAALNRLIGVKDIKKPIGVLSNEAEDAWDKGIGSVQSILEREGQAELSKAQAAATKESPWAWGDWTGYVPKVNQAEREQNSWLLGALGILGNTALSKNPNVSPQLTSEKNVLSQQDKDALSTKQTTWDANAAVGGNLQGMYPGGVGVDTSPLFGGVGSPSFEYDTNPAATPNYDDPESIDPNTGLTYIGASGPGVTGLMRGVPEKAAVQAEKQSLASLARHKLERDRGEGAIGKAFKSALGDFGSKSKPKLKPKAAVAVAKTPSKSKSTGSGNARTRQLADGRRTPSAKRRSVSAPAPVARREVGVGPRKLPSGVKNYFPTAAQRAVTKGGKTKAQVSQSKKKRYRTTPRAV